MKTPEELKAQALDESGCCGQCVFYCTTVDNPFGCQEAQLKTALVAELVAYTEQLESTIRQVSKALCGKENATPDELLQAVDQLKSRLAQAELERDAAAHEWISVKDRLPEESDGTVLVCFPNKSPYNLREQFVNAKHDRRVRTAWYSQYSNTWYIGDMCGVGRADPTHWMPLPEPTKEE